jgi:hypothetical protein
MLFGPGWWKGDLPTETGAGDDPSPHVASTIYRVVDVRRQDSPAGEFFLATGQQLGEPDEPGGRCPSPVQAPIANCCATCYPVLFPSTLDPEVSWRGLSDCGHRAGYPRGAYMRNTGLV